MKRTSVTHPLRISEHEEASWSGGKLGITFCPGKKQAASFTGTWDRDLQLDMDAINRWGPDVVVTLVEAHEFALLEVPEFPEVAGNQEWEWLHLPTKDECAPDAGFVERWKSSGTGERLAGKLMAGGRVLVHCKGGLGRAGTVAAMLLRHADPAISSEKAIAAIRNTKSRYCIDPPQERFLLDWNP